MSGNFWQDYNGWVTRDRSASEAYSRAAHPRGSRVAPVSPRLYQVNEHPTVDGRETAHEYAVVSSRTGH